MFKKSDPFYEIRRTYEGTGGGSWHAVYRSKQVMDNLSPTWEPATVDVNALCDGDLDRKIQVAIFDWEKDGKHDSMGQFETTGKTEYIESLLYILPLRCSSLFFASLVNSLINAAERKSTFTPKKGSKEMGTIHVDQCKITGAEKAATPAADSSVLPVPVPVPVDQMANMSLGAGQKPSFVDYVTGNCDLGMVRFHSQ